MHILFYLLLLVIAQQPLMLSAQDATNAPTIKESDIPLPPSLQQAEAPSIEQEDRFFSQFLNMLFTLGLIVFALLALNWVLKRMTNARMQQENTASEIKILERRSITPRTAVYLLEIKNKTIAIAESHSGVIKLSEFDFELK